MRNRWLIILFCVVSSTPCFADEEHPVNITVQLPYVSLQNAGHPLRIERNQDTENMIDFDYGLTSRACPPFCVLPMTIAPGVETIGELELLDYIIRQDRGDEAILIIDSRTEEWTSRGMIPGATSIPWTRLSVKTASAKEITELLLFNLGAAQAEGLWNFENAKTLVLYCNGPWCGQSPSSIRTLLAIGYPAHKIKWYRMGMQGWRMLGFNVVIPGEE